MIRHTVGVEASVPIATVTPRTVVAVAGRIVSIKVEPRDHAPVFSVRVDDGTGRIEAVFLGRRKIYGIEPGAHIRLQGRVNETDSVPRLFNPSFELGP